jgi:AcrR family transcriptional regulator
MADIPTGRYGTHPGVATTQTTKKTSRERLLEAAAKVFAERGYQAASVDEIAAAAGLSKGAVYWNFSSKDELFHALLEERIDRQLEETAEFLRSAPTDRPIDPAVANRWEATLGRERELMLLSQELWARAVRDPELRARYAERQARLRDVLADGLRTRVRRTGAPPFSTPAEDVAAAFLALANGLALQRLIDPEGVPDGLLENITSLIYEGLVARASTQSE